MRRALVVLYVLALVRASVAQDERGETQYLDVARLAMEAQIKIGDALREKGDVEGALDAYRKAVALFEAASRREPAPRVRGDGAIAPVREGVRRREEPSAEPAAAVTRALEWLARHQDDDGRWDCDGFMKHDELKDPGAGPGLALHDAGVTGLAVLAFLGAGHTDRGGADANRFARNVRMGLRYLVMNQSEDGAFGTRATHSFMYSQAMATLAMCEAYRLTRNPRYGKPAQEGLNFIAMARNPYMAWRYEPRGGENDTSVTVWCTMALRSGKQAGLDVDPDAFEGVRLWIDKMTDPNFGRVGYNYPGGTVARPEGKQDKFPPQKSEAMTAAGMLCRIMTGEDPGTSQAIRKGANLLIETLPAWSPDGGTIDMYYWHLGSLAMWNVGGPAWRRWSASMQAAIVDTQLTADAGARVGSWDPVGPWGDTGGRVYSTAMMAMCLEVYYRYERVFRGQ